MTLTPANKQKLLEIAKAADIIHEFYGFIEMKKLIGTDNAQKIFKTNYNLKILARVIRRFVRTGVLEFKKSEVRE